MRLTSRPANQPPLKLRQSAEAVAKADAGRYRYLPTIARRGTIGTFVSSVARRGTTGALLSSVARRGTTGAFLSSVASGFSRTCGRAVGRGGLVILCAVALILAPATPAFAYLKFGVTIGGQAVPVKWTGPVRYFVANTATTGVAAPDLQAAVGRAFSTWQAVPTASVSYQFVGFTNASPLQEDGQSTLGFAARPDLDRVLASTDILIDETTGQIVEADIFFNSAMPWSVAAAGETNRYDLESVALHEIGHMSGLAHSALGETELRSDGGRRVLSAEAVMFPIAYPPGNILDRTLLSSTLGS